MKTHDELGSLEHLLWGTCPREGPGLWWGLQEDDLCPSSGAGLALKQKLNFIHCQCRRSFKRNAALTAEAAGAIFPRLHPACRSPALVPHNRLGLPSSAWLILPGTLLPVRAHGPQLQHGFTSSSILIFNQHLLRGSLELLWGLLPLFGVSALCLSLAERAGMTFPKGKTNLWGIQKLRVGVEIQPPVPPVPLSFTPPSSHCESCNHPVPPKPCPAEWIFKIGL